MRTFTQLAFLISLGVWLSCGCHGVERRPGWSDADSDTDNDTDGDTDGDTDADADTDTDVDTETGTGWDCEDLSDGPFAFTVITGPKATEDFAFDDEGFLIGASTGNLFKSSYSGESVLWVPGAGGFIAGLRALPDGDIVFSDVSSGTIFRVDKTTAIKTPVVSGLSYSNGIEIGIDGFIYTAEESAGRVRRIDPDTGEFSYVAEGLVEPNGLSFSPDYSRLYIGSFGGGIIYQVDIDADGNGGPVGQLASSVGTGSLDGMGVDICGNVYVCDYGQIKILRIPPDGSEIVPVVDLSSVSSWIPNMQWGSGLGGWDSLKLYVQDISDTVMYEIDLGIPSKYRPYP